MATIDRSVLKIDRPEVQQGTTAQHRVRPLMPAAMRGDFAATEPFLAPWATRRGCGLHPDSASRNRLQIDANLADLHANPALFRKAARRRWRRLLLIGRCAGRVGRVLISSSVADLRVHIAPSARGGAA